MESQPIAETTTTPEQSAPVQPDKPVEDSKIEEAYKRISKQESHLKSERDKIDAARKAFEAEKEKAARYSSLEGQDPFTILEHFGISYEALLKADADRRTNVSPESKRALEKIQELESKINAKQEQEERERRQRAERQLREDLQKTVKERQFDVIEVMQAEDMVIEYMEEMYSLSNEIPSYEESCRVVAEALLDKYSKIAETNMFKSRQPKVEVKPETKEEPKKEEKPKSLNQLSSQSSMTGTPTGKRKTNEDLLKEAMEQYKKLAIEKGK